MQAGEARPRRGADVTAGRRPGNGRTWRHTENQAEPALANAELLRGKEALASTISPFAKRCMEGFDCLGDIIEPAVYVTQAVAARQMLVLAQEADLELKCSLLAVGAFARSVQTLTDLLSGWQGPPTRETFHSRLSWMCRKVGVRLVVRELVTEITPDHNVKWRFQGASYVIGKAGDPEAGILVRIMDDRVGAFDHVIPASRIDGSGFVCMPDLLREVEILSPPQESGTPTAEGGALGCDPSGAQGLSSSSPPPAQGTSPAAGGAAPGTNPVAVPAAPNGPGPSGPMRFVGVQPPPQGYDWVGGYVGQCAPKGVEVGCLSIIPLQKTRIGLASATLSAVSRYGKDIAYMPVTPWGVGAGRLMQVTKRQFRSGDTLIDTFLPGDVLRIDGSVYAAESHGWFMRLRCTEWTMSLASIVPRIWRRANVALVGGNLDVLGVETGRKVDYTIAQQGLKEGIECSAFRVAHNAARDMGFKQAPEAVDALAEVRRRLADQSAKSLKYTCGRSDYLWGYCFSCGKSAGGGRR